VPGRPVNRAGENFTKSEQGHATLASRKQAHVLRPMAELPTAKDHWRSVSISGPNAGMVTRPTL